MTLAPAIALGLVALLRGADDSAAIDAAIAKAVSWVDALAVDPKALREKNGMRGKAHFAEKLFVYYVLARDEKDPAKRAARIEKFESAYAPAADPAFHAFDDSDPKLFREDVLPYLTVLYLASRLGRGEAAAAEAVAAKLPAIAKEFPNRAVHWRMSLSFLIGRLGAKPPATLESLAPRSVLAERRGTNSLGTEDTYALAREILVLSAYGEEPVSWPTPESRLYAQAALPLLVQRAIRDDDADLLAEILVAMRSAGFAASPTFTDGVRHLLSRQNENGSFGRYERRRAELARAGSRFEVDAGAYLHTTEVAIWALVEARAVSTSAAEAPTPR